MIDLTEQWKKGELDRNEVYYYETPFNTTDTASGFWLCNNCDKNDKIEVLAPVPSYDEWKAAYEYEKYADNEIKNLKAQNAELKEALKECQEKILLMDYDNIKIEILQKIDEVLR